MQFFSTSINPVSRWPGALWSPSFLRYPYCVTSYPAVTNSDLSRHIFSQAFGYHPFVGFAPTKGQARNDSIRNSLRWPIHIINPADKPNYLKKQWNVIILKWGHKEVAVTEITHKLRLQTWQNNACCKTLITLFFFYKNLFYKNVEAEIDPNFKNVLRTFLRLRVD